MPANDQHYGSQWREFPPISDRLTVHTNTDDKDKHPSAVQKKQPTLSTGMAAKQLKYQKAKRVKRRAPNGKDLPTQDGSELTDIAMDTGTPMSGEEKHIASMYLDGVEGAEDYFI